MKTGELTDFKADGIFIYVGNVPSTGFLRGKVEMDERGYIISNDMMETSVSGVYVAGDAREKYLRQVVTAAADGATAAVAAERYIIEREDFIAETNPNKPLLMAFWSPVVEGSLEMISGLEKAVAGSGNKFRLMKIDMSCKKNIAKKYNIREVPSVYLIKDGKEPVRIKPDVAITGLEKLLNK